MKTMVAFQRIQQCLVAEFKVCGLASGFSVTTPRLPKVEVAMPHLPLTNDGLCKT